MRNKLINQILNNIDIDFVIYGNFHFIDGPDEDIDLLIKNEDYSKLKAYLSENEIKYHTREFYPGQIFITGTEIKLHITNDLYVGGRNVAYLIKLKLINNIFKDKIVWNGLPIISMKDFIKYRLIKRALNYKKELKYNEYPFNIDSELINLKLKLEVFVLLITGLLLNIVFIPFRFIKKRIWVRLLQ